MTHASEKKRGGGAKCRSAKSIDQCQPAQFTKADTVRTILSCLNCLHSRGLFYRFVQIVSYTKWILRVSKIT